MKIPAVLELHNTPAAKINVLINPDNTINEPALLKAINRIQSHDPVRDIYTDTYNGDHRVFIIDVDSLNTIGTMVLG